jgi:hypothetical protein
MKRLISIVGLVTILLMPSFVFSQTEQMTTGSPPIAQSLVREGDLAIKLVEALKIGTARTEAEAETILGSSGIAPKNGWIADYPVTPDIISELQSAIGGAADAGKLPINKDEALKAFGDLTTSLDLHVVPDASGKHTGSKPRRDYGSYSDPTVINNYYYTEGPPVVTYYPPPWDYYYLYSWVSWPFWYHGFHFHGFFVLSHFHRPIFLHKKVVVVSNRVFDPVNKKVFVVDPVQRGAGRGPRVEVNRTGTSGFHSGDARRGAASIVERSRERTSGPGNSMTVRPSTLMGGGEGAVRQSIPDRSGGRDQSGTGERGSSGRVFSQQGNIAPRNEINFQRPSVPVERPSSGPGRRVERSFSTPSMDGSGSGAGRSERAFSSPGQASGAFSGPAMGNRGFSGEFRSGRSSGEISGGSGGGNRGSAFQDSSGNRGSGGCRGRC